MLHDVLDGLVDHLVERLRVLAQLLGRAGERFGDARPELGLEHRQHMLASPHAQVAGISVVRIVPGLESFRGARRTRRLAPDGEERTDPRRAVVVHPHGRHALQAAGAGSAGQPQQHGLRLVVEGVAEQHGCILGPRDPPQRGVAGGPCVGLRPLPRFTDDDPFHERLDAERRSLRRGLGGDAL